MTENNEKNSVEARIEVLTDALAAAPDDAALADVYYRRGRLFWKLGEKGRAMSDYGRAAALDGDSPAVEALKLCGSVMDFYNTDIYNP